MKNILRIIIVFIVVFLLSYFSLAILKHSGGGELFRAKNPYDLVVNNIRIIDGSGGDVFIGAVGVRGEEIIKLSPRINNRESTVYIDGSGLTLAPAFLVWPESNEWIERDLASAFLRYPERRLLVKDSPNKAWIGRTLAAILSEEEITENDILADINTRVYIITEQDIPIPENVNTAFYLLSGWRGELLEINEGKIAEGYKSKMIIFEHKKYTDEELLAMLRAERYPRAKFTIEGTRVFDENGRELFPEVIGGAEEEPLSAEEDSEAGGTE